MNTEHENDVETVTTLRKLLAQDPKAMHAFEFFGWSHYKGDPTPGEDASYSGLEPMASYKDSARFAMIPHTTGSDYSGGALVRANRKVLAELLESAEQNAEVSFSFTVSGGHATEGIALCLDVEAPESDLSPIVELATGLQDYPCADDETLSEVEQEEFAESWESDGRKDFAKELRKRIDAVSGTDDWIDDIEGEGIDNLFHMANDDGSLIVHEESHGPHVDVEKASERTSGLAILIATTKLSVDWQRVTEALLEDRAGDDERYSAEGVLRIVRLHQCLRNAVAHVAYHMEQKDLKNGTGKGSDYQWRATDLMLRTLEQVPGPVSYRDKDNRWRYDHTIFAPVTKEWAENATGSAVEVLVTMKDGTRVAKTIDTTKKGSQLNLAWQWGHEEFATLFGL